MIHGYLHPDFADVAVALRATLRHRRGGGGAAAVYHRGEKVVDIWSGSRDREGRLPWLQDTVSMSFSTTKGVVATAAHRLADRGELDLDAPVAEYWPEFKAAGKEDVRVANLLDHSAGLHRLRGVVPDAATLLDWDATTSALAAAAPAYPVGTRHGYHAITYGYLVGEVLRRITGLSVHDVIQREIATPLDLDGLSIGAPGEMRDRIATLLTVWPDADRAQRVVGWLDRAGIGRHSLDAFMVEGFDTVIEDESIYDAEMPAANGCFTARSLARMYSVLAAGGVDEQGRTFISPETLARATRVRTTARDVVIHFPMRWRLGYHMAATTRGVLPRGFGHFGLGGSGAWADPDLGLSVAMTCNRMAGTPFGDQRLLRISSAAVRAARSR